MPTYDLTELSELVLDRVEGNSILYTQPELTGVINESLRVLNLFTGFNMTSVHLVGFTVADQLLYDVPGELAFPTRVSFEGRDLNKLGLSDIGQNYRTWATDTTNNYGPVANWVPIGTRQFAIHPIDSIGGNDLLVTGVADTTPLAAGGDVMELDDEWVSLITEYGGSRVVLKEAGKIFSDASILIQNFWHQMKSLRRWQGLKMPRYYVQVQEPQ